MTSFPPGPVDGTHIYDDFHSNLSIADGLIGKLNWDMTTIANVSTPTFVASPNGILRLVTDGTSGDGVALTLEDDVLALSGTNQVFRCRVRYPEATIASSITNVVAANNFRIGFIDVLTAGDPDVGIWIDSAAGVLSFDVASTSGDKTKNVTGIPTLTSGTTMILGTWYDLELQLSETNSAGGPAVIKCFVDGFAAGEITGAAIGSTETMAFAIIHWTSASEERGLDIDYYEAYLPRN